jgi:ferritin-like metal-binding protein YciE
MPCHRRDYRRGRRGERETKDEDIRDAAMLAAAQSVERYEIARYGTLIAWAGKMEMSDAAKLLEATLQEEKAREE